MARIVFYAMAHRGDVFPYVPVATQLSTRGHDVVFVTPREFHPMFEDEPFTCVHSGTDFSPIELDQHGDFLRRWGMRFAGGATLRLYFRKLTIPFLDTLTVTLDGELDGADVVVSHPGAAVIAAMPCEQRGLRWIVPDLFPMLLPTRAMPPAGVPNLGPRANEWVWNLVRKSALDWYTSAGAFKRYRSSIGLSNEGWNLIDARLSPHRSFGLASRHYVDQQPDWPDGYELVGFTSWEGPAGGAIPAEVQAFLDAGEPPVIVTLGSSGASARPELFEQVLGLLDHHGIRGLCLTSNDAINERVRAAAGAQHGVWPFVPLRALLPHTRAIVQSGAHGTNALALEAGLPSVVVPCLFDQLWHGQRHEQLGTGVLVRRRRQLSPAIDRLLSDSSLGEASRQLSEKLAQENGTTRAADQIEAFLRG